MIRNIKRRWVKVDFYRAVPPGITSAAEQEWRECARWVVLFGPEFAQAFGMKSEEREHRQAA